MNNIERLVASINFLETDRVPVVASVFGHVAHFNGIPLREYLQSGELIAKAQLKALEHYGYDMVFAFMDVNVETEAMGSVLRYRDYEYPYIERYAFSSTTDFSALVLPDLSRAGRIPELLRAARVLCREVGDTTPVTGCVLGPLNLACQLIGMENALYLAVDDSASFSQLLDFATELCIAYGVAQLEAGVHQPIVFDVSASSEIIPAAFFREFEMPRLEKVFSSFKAAGAVANWLFITGNIDPILPYFPEIGVDIANFDYCVSPEAVKRALPHTCVNGNIKSFLFEYGRPADIEVAAKGLLSAFSDRGGFILTAGCEIPPRSSSETIDAMVAAVAEP